MLRHLKIYCIQKFLHKICIKAKIHDQFKLSNFFHQSFHHFQYYPTKPVYTINFNCQTLKNKNNKYRYRYRYRCCKKGITKQI